MNQYKSRKLRIHLMISLVSSLMVNAIVFADGPAHCRPVNGHSSTRIFSGGSCTSPVGLCTTGEVSGGLHGRLDVTVLSSEPAHPSIPTVVRFIGQSVITTNNGSTLIGTDAGAFDTDPTSDGHLGTLLTWTGGTGDFAGASGHIVIDGHVDLAAGTVRTHYRGNVCTR